LSLKSLLDQVCFGTYDFLYLRIDFKSGFNVGYAFINFADVAGMIAVLDNIEHCGWVGYRSNKHAEISYATIQGREALIQKFRNSSVMQETPFCRPRLFTPYDDAIAMNAVRFAGIEQPFPNPDNLSKLQRSMDSARSVGLFPPSTLANNTGQRGTMSGWDRGNPRDLHHTTAQRNLSRATWTDQMKRECEAYHTGTYGYSAQGPVPFEYLPAGFIQEYLRIREANIAFNSAGPGVIGQQAFQTSGGIARVAGGTASGAPYFQGPVMHPRATGMGPSNNTRTS
jgi:hypothetical protein